MYFYLEQSGPDTNDRWRLPVEEKKTSRICAALLPLTTEAIKMYFNPGEV